jgi:anti-anti-sigma factor
MSMDLTIEPQGDVTVVKARGDINAASCGRLEEALTGLIDQGRMRLVLDLADVRYVSSAGLRVLLVAAKRLAGKGAFALSRASEPVRQVLDMTGFSGIIKVKPSLDEAVAQVSA